jgi:hypothetical protein
MLMDLPEAVAFTDRPGDDDRRSVYVRQILTHAEYDKNNWK